MTNRKNVYDSNEALECTMPETYLPAHYARPELISNELLKIANLISVTSDKTGMLPEDIFLQLSKNGKLLRQAIKTKAEIRILSYELKTILRDISENII